MNPEDIKGIKRPSKKLLKVFGKTTSDGTAKNGMQSGCKTTESNTEISSPYDVEVKKVIIKDIKIKE